MYRAIMSMRLKVRGVENSANFKATIRKQLQPNQRVVELVQGCDVATEWISYLHAEKVILNQRADNSHILLDLNGAIIKPIARLQNCLNLLRVALMCAVDMKWRECLVMSRCGSPCQKRSGCLTRIMLWKVGALCGWVMLPNWLKSAVLTPRPFASITSYTMQEIRFFC